MQQALVRQRYHRAPCHRDRRTRGDGRRQRLELGALELEAYVRHLAGRPMHARVGDVLQPWADVGVGRGDIELEPRLLQGRCEWDQEARLEIAVEALDFALGLGPVRAAAHDPEAILLGEREQMAVKGTL